MTAVYERATGGHVAERIHPEPGSDHELELDQLAADPSTHWRKVDAEAPAKVVGEGRFDPSRHDVGQVLIYLDGAGATEALRVLDAEATGKNRKTIVDRRAEILAREAAADAEPAARLAANQNPEEE